MMDHTQEAHQRGAAPSASPSQGPQGNSPATQSGASPSAPPPVPAAQSPPGLNRRRPDGRERPYRALRVLAKLYAIFAPLVLIGLVLVALVGWARQAPVAEKVGSTVGILLLAGLYYLLMKSVSQAIYILFDIAAHTRRTRELVETRESRSS